MKKKFLSSLLLGLLGIALTLPLLVQTVSAAESGNWIDSNTISFRSAEFRLHSIDGQESYIQDGDVSDLCVKDQHFRSQDTKKYASKYGDIIHTIRDISGNNKSANYIEYQIATFSQATGKEVPGDQPFDSSITNGTYYGCKEVPNSKVGITLGDSPQANWQFRWVDKGTIERSDGSRTYTRNDGGEYVWKADGNSSGCKEKIIPAGDNKTGILYHDGEKAGDGSCAFKQDPHSIASPENFDKPAGTGDAHSTDSSSGSGEDSKPSCESKGGKLSWLLCPVLEYVGDFLQKVDEQLNHLLQVPNNYFECAPDSQNNCDAVKQLKDSWARIRNIAYIFLVPMVLVMTIGTALGFELISAYTVKKALPRLVIALIFMSLSYEITRFFIILSNDVGRGVLGLMTSAFTGHKDITLAELFDPNGLSGGSFTAIILAGGALALGALGIVLSYAFVAALIIFAAFLLLALRQMLLIALIVIAPLAILVWIFPGNDKFWKIWRETFTGLLLLYPLVMLLIGAGRAFAVLVQGAEGAGLLQTILILTAYIGPYFFIPAAFKFAGGVFSNLSGMVNDRSRGLLDRQKKYRERKYGEKYRDMKANDYYKHGPGRRFNRNLAGITAGPKGNFGLGAKGRNATAANARVAAAAAAKDNPKLNDLAQNSDEGTAILALSGGSAAGARQARAQLLESWRQQRLEEHQAAVNAGTMTQQAAEDDALLYATNRADRGFAAASSVGFSRTNANAALTLMGQNKSRAIAPGRMDLVRNGIDRLAPTNEVERQDLEDSYNYQSRSAGRFDLGAATALEGFNRGSLYQVANGHEGSVNGAAREVLQRINSGNATQEDFEQGAVLRLELDEIIRSATGPVRDAAVAQGQALDQSALRGFMDTVVAQTNRSVQVNYDPQNNPQHQPRSAVNPNGWDAQEIARGWRMEQRTVDTTTADQLRGRARVYQREDPNVINQSDRRLKTNIRIVTTLENGITLYSFRYLWSNQVYVGVMAQDLLETYPEAVYIDSKGFYGVYYARLGLRMLTIEEWQASPESLYAAPAPYKVKR